VSTTPASSPEPSAVTGRQPSRKPNVGRGLKTLLYVVVAVITTAFLLINSQTVEVNFLFATVEVPLFVALAVALVLGVLLALGAVGMRKVRSAKVRRGEG
jgi:uncharacterized integral membrane protein